MFDRRWLLGGAAAATAGGVAAWRAMQPKEAGEVGIPQIAGQVGAMPYRAFGRTGLKVSELSFGAWAIGGKAYGSVDRAQSLEALARAEELGCNLVDTAAVYGDSESVLSEFLRGRRDRWLVSTKYSNQKSGMAATLETQLRRLGTDHVDLYMVHWVPGEDEAGLLTELEALKQSGKVRFTGLSASSIGDVDHLLDHTRVDAVMLPISLLDPDPLLARRARLAAAGKALLARSPLKEGFLAGKFTRDSRFMDADDLRSKLSAEQVAGLVDLVERFRFLEATHGNLARAALAYPLSFPEVSTTVVGIKNARQAEMNFADCAGARLSADELTRVHALQDELGLRKPDGIIARVLARMLGLLSAP